MKSKKLSIPYIIWMLVFTMIPIVMIGLTAFRDKKGNFSLQPFVNAYDYRFVFLKSLWIALLSTAICLLLAYSLAALLIWRFLCSESTAATSATPEPS